MTAQVIKSSTETIPNEANDLIPVSCWLPAGQMALTPSPPLCLGYLSWMESFGNNGK
jgi:hypothetical protein